LGDQEIGLLGNWFYLVISFIRWWSNWVAALWYVGWFFQKNYLL